MARTDGEQGDILEAITKALIDNIGGLSAKNCFISIYPNPPYKIPDNLFVTVSPAASNYPEEFTSGGGQNQCTEDSSVLVTIFSRFQCNRAGQEREALNDQNRGILQMKRSILKTLCSLDLTVNANFELRNQMQPKRCGAPEYVGDEQLLTVSMEFSVTWDWDLTA
jgi:hypothetical protein